MKSSGENAFNENEKLTDALLHVLQLSINGSAGGMRLSVESIQSTMSQLEEICNNLNPEDQYEYADSLQTALVGMDPDLDLNPPMNTGSKQQYDKTMEIFESVFDKILYPSSTVSNGR